MREGRVSVIVVMICIDFEKTERRRRNYERKKERKKNLSGIQKPDNPGLLSLFESNSVSQFKASVFPRSITSTLRLEVMNRLVLRLFVLSMLFVLILLDYAVIHATSGTISFSAIRIFISTIHTT